MFKSIIKVNNHLITDKFRFKLKKFISKKIKKIGQSVKLVS